MRDALVRIGRFAEPPLEPIVPAASQFGYRNKLEYSFTAGEDGVDLGFHRAGRWDEVIGIEECLLTTDVGNAIRLAVRDWAREERLEPYDQETGHGYLRHLVVREGRNTGQALVVLVTAPGERFEAGYLVDVLRRFPEVRSIHWAINDTPAEQTNLPTQAPVGRRRDRGGDPRSALPRPSVGVPADEHGDGRAALRARARVRGSDRGRERLRPLLRHRHDRPRARREARAPSGGSRSPRRRSPARSRTPSSTASTNAQFFAGNVGQTIEELREEAGSPDVVVVDPPRAGLAGKALRRTGALGAPRHRLRLVQSDDARLGSPGAPRRVRLRARALPPRRHVPAHAARRVRLGAQPGSRRARASAADVAPEQVGVRERGSRGRRPAAPGGPAMSSHAPDEHECPGEARAHPDPRRGDAEPEAVGRGEEEREEEDVRRAEVHDRRLAGRREGDRDAARRSRVAPRRRTRSVRRRPTRCRPTGRAPRRA